MQVDGSTVEMKKRIQGKKEAGKGEEERRGKDREQWRNSGQKIPDFLIVAAYKAYPNPIITIVTEYPLWRSNKQDMWQDHFGYFVTTL